MDYIRMYNDLSLRNPDNMVSPFALLRGHYYICHYNGHEMLIRCFEYLETHYVKVIYIVYNGVMMDEFKDRLLYTLCCCFYKVKCPLFDDIKKSHVAPDVPTLRMLAYNKLEPEDKIQYAYAASVYGQFPPIPQETISTLSTFGKG